MILGFLLGAVLGSLATLLVWGVCARAARKAIREHLQTQRLKRSDEVRALTRGLTHELKNPLSTIGLNADLLREAVHDARGIDEADRSPIVRRTQAIQRESERLTGILQDFERFAGEVRLHLKASDLNAVTDELVDFYAPQAAAAGIRIRADLCPQRLMSEVDADQLKQAMLNLVLNATQAMAAQVGASAAKELILRTRLSESGTEPDEPSGVIHVIDTGPGVPDDVRARMFEPYYTTKPSGSGIGLAITKRIIDEHGGTLTVFSELGRGTDFQITLPLKNE